MYDHEVVGYAQGSVAAIVPSTGEFGNITVHTKGFDAAHEDAFLTNGNYQWSTPSSWSSAGLSVLIFFIPLCSLQQHHRRGCAEL